MLILLAYITMSKSELVSHFASECRGVKSRVNALAHTCKICGEQYTAQHFLKRHMKRHGRRCWKKFYVRIAIISCIAGARGKLVLKCDNCTKYFATEADRDQHQIEIHEKQAICPHCPKKYKNRNLLSSHITNKHSGKDTANRFICPKCGKKVKYEISHERAPLCRYSHSVIDHCSGQQANHSVWRQPSRIMRNRIVVRSRCSSVKFAIKLWTPSTRYDNI